MPPPKSKPSVAFNTRLPPELYEAIVQHSRQTGTKINAIVIAALTNFFGAPTEDPSP